MKFHSSPMLSSLRTWCLGVAAVLLLDGFSPLRAEVLQPGDLVAMCGDSITAQKLYTLYVEDYLVLCQPVPKLQAIQFGWGGERASGLLERMKSDVLPFHPSVVTICYGMNDGYYAPSSPKNQEGYRQALAGVIENFKKAGVRHILLSAPTAVDASAFKKLSPEVYNQTLEDLGKIGKEMATKEGLGFVDMHSALLAAMAKAKAKYGDNYSVAGSDGIHPNRNGHLVMAYAFLKALGCSGEIGTITLDMKSGKAQATEGHAVCSAGSRFVELESTRYPFCFYGDPAKQDSTRGMIEFVPFNEELNRFKLVVVNAPAENLKVTWGSGSKVFSAADLSKGINLAAEFLDNPFSKPFEEADQKIREKQFQETPLSKSLLHSLPDWVQVFPEEAAAFQSLSDKIIERSVAQRKASSATVVPVKHRIEVEVAP